MLLGELVLGQVERLEAVRAELLGHLPALGTVANAEAHEDVRLLGVGDPVGELRHLVRPDDRAEPPEAAALLWDREREQGLSLLAHLGPVGDEAEAVEVHVRATGDRDQRLAADALALRVGLRARHRERAGRLENRARVLEHVLDRRAHLVGVAEHDLIDELAAEPERLLADLLDRHAVGEQPNVRELDAPAGGDRLRHRV